MIKVETLFIDDKQNGKRFNYFENGNKKFEFWMEDDKINGIV